MNLVCVELAQTPEGKGLPLPSYATADAAGMDLLAAVEGPVALAPGERRMISTGIRIGLPQGFEAQVRPRSGLAMRHGIGLVNSPGTIDADYRGTVAVIVINHGHEPYTIHRGDRIAQMIVAPVVRAEWRLVQELEATARGEGGFGHTGK